MRGVSVLPVFVGGLAVAITIGAALVYSGVRAMSEADDPRLLAQFMRAPFETFQCGVRGRVPHLLYNGYPLASLVVGDKFIVLRCPAFGDFIFEPSEAVDLRLERSMTGIFRLLRIRSGTRNITVVIDSSQQQELRDALARYSWSPGGV